MTLYEVIHHPLNSTQLGCVLYSNTFSPFLGLPSPPLVLQYTTESTIRMTPKNLFEILSTQYNVISSELSEWSPPELTSLPPTSKLSSPRNLESVLTSVCDSLNNTEDYLCSLSHAYQRSRTMNKLVLQLTRVEKERATERLNDVKDRIGHLHEEVMRQAISVVYGYGWGSPANITGFTDAICFVANGLGKSPVERDMGKGRLVKRFCQQLYNFNFDGPEQSMVDKKNPEECLLEQNKLEKQYFEV